MNNPHASGAILRNIPTDLLRSFVSAIDTGSFTRAAGAVGRTQSAVSLQIRRLEQMLGARLFLRDAHRLTLTAEGATVAQYARRMLALNDEVLALLHSPGLSGRVRLGVPYEYAAALLPVILGRFAQSHPNVTLEVTSDLTRNLLRRYREGAFDLVLALHDPDSPGGRVIVTEPLLWFAGADHDRWQQRPLPLVLAPPPCVYRGRILAALTAQGVPLRVAYLSSSHEAVLAAVRAGLGISAMAQSTIPADARLLPPGAGLPPLGRLDLRLHGATGRAPQEAVSHLADYIAQSFLAPPNRAS